MSENQSSNAPTEEKKNLTDNPFNMGYAKGVKDTADLVIKFCINLATEMERLINPETEENKEEKTEETTDG